MLYTLKAFEEVYHLITCRVSYSRISPPPPDFTQLISTCNNISATSLLGSHKTPEATSEGLNLKHFQGAHPQSPPQSQCASHDQLFPVLNTKSCMKPDMYVIMTNYLHYTKGT